MNCVNGQSSTRFNNHWALNGRVLDVESTMIVKTWVATHEYESFEAQKSHLCLYMSLEVAAWMRIAEALDLKQAF